MTEHTGRRALITGSSRGLGLCFARRLAAGGCDVILHGLEHEDEVAPAISKLGREFGVDASYRRVDLARETDVEDWVATLVREHEGVDILVNNAVIRHFSPIDEFPLEKWQAALAVNLTAPFQLIRGLLPGMKARNRGRIVNLSSLYATRGAVNRPDYVTTKTALLGLTRSVALETARFDITCNALCPGSVLTPDIERRVGEIAQQRGLSRDEAVAVFLEGKQPSGRFVAEADVAEYLAFICSPAARDINGALLTMDGGWSAA